MNKFSRRLVKVLPEHNEEVKKLLHLMGIPVVQATGEAEAQCAALAKAGKVWATATEDMDALTFGSPVLLRHMTFSAARKVPIAEFRLEKALEGLELDMDHVNRFFNLNSHLTNSYSLLTYAYCPAATTPIRFVELDQGERCN